MQPFISDMTPLVSILNRIIRVLGSNTSWEIRKKNKQNHFIQFTENIIKLIHLELKNPQNHSILVDQAIQNSIWIVFCFFYNFGIIFKILEENVFVTCM